jgi:hypothetical protein
MNKKGFIFTFISVLLVSVIVLAFLIQYSSRTRVNIEKVNTEVETMNSFVKSLNNDYLPRALEISGNQAILSLLRHMELNGIYAGYDIDDDEEMELRRIIINAMIDETYKNGWGEVPNAPKLELMEIDEINYNLSSTINEIVILANYTGMNFNIGSDIYSIPFKQAIIVFQDNPWYVNISMVISYEITNKDEDISWSYDNIKINATIPLVNFRDPIYLKEPDEPVNITILKTQHELPSEIEQHVLDSNFVACEFSPSFMDRMQGNVDVSSIAGIESLVDIKSPAQSTIDYQYFGLENPGQISQIGDSGYYIDDSHSQCYGL